MSRIINEFKVMINKVINRQMIQTMDGFSGGVWGVQTCPEITQFRLFHYDEITLTAKA